MLSVQPQGRAPCTIAIACNYMAALCFFIESLYKVVRSSAYFIRNLDQSCFALCWIITLVLTQGRDLSVSSCSTKSHLKRS